MLGEEVTRELIADFRNFAVTMIFRFCGEVKTKMTKERMKRLVMSTQCRGSICVLDELLVLAEKEEVVDRDFLLATIHIMRMNMWNEATLYAEGLKKVELETAMKVNVDLDKVFTGKYMGKVKNVIGVITN